MTLLISIHLYAALGALLLGIVMFIRAKGTRMHMALGAVWVAAMIITAGSSFAIREMDANGGMTWIHGLSAWILVSLAAALWAIMRGHPRTHRGFMAGSYAGLCIAGAFALSPDRIFGRLIWSAIGLDR